MRYLIIAFSFLVIISCSDSGDAINTDEYTGREISFDLVQGSDFPIAGDVSFKELSNKSVEITVSLSGTEGDIFHPVHLHSDDLSAPDADIAVLLNDVYGKNGVSTTVIDKLADESNFDFDRIDEYYGSIKVHLAATGDGRDIVLAGGNIGLAQKSNPTGRSTIAVCKSE